MNIERDLLKLNNNTSLNQNHQEGIIVKL